MQRSIGAIRDRNQVIDAERLPTAVAVELVATGAQQFAAGRVSAGANFQDGVSNVSVVLDGQAVEKGAAGGAGSGSELRFHEFIIAKQRSLVNRKIVQA